ncbi:MAG: RNA polymerase sigma factor [Thermoanaerobaculia bacterium]
MIGAQVALAPRALSEPRFEAFYRRTAKPLWGYLLRMTGDAAAADDLSQRAWLQFLRTPLDSDEESRLRGLVYRTATNLAIDEIRRSRREREGLLALFSMPRRREQSDLAHDLGRAFLELKPKERSMLWLAHVEGFDHREIAGMLGVEPASVKVLLFRARKRLTAILEKMGLGPEVLP